MNTFYTMQGLLALEKSTRDRARKLNSFDLEDKADKISKTYDFIQSYTRDIECETFYCKGIVKLVSLCDDSVKYIKYKDIEKAITAELRAEYDEEQSRVNVCNNYY